jgi:hypothetical protein
MARGKSGLVTDSTGCRDILQDEMTIEGRDKRFGVIGIDKGFITEDQLVEALRIQVEEDSSGKPHSLIGIILIRHGHLTKEQAEEILLALRKT